MLRGTKKQIIHLKHTESPLFEEAFFIVKQTPPREITSRTLAEEANRLLGEPQVQERDFSPVPRKTAIGRWALAFLLGVACGAAVFTLCLLL